MKTMINTIILAFAIGLLPACSQSDNKFAADSFSMTSMPENDEVALVGSSHAEAETSPLQSSTSNTVRFAPTQNAAAPNYIAAPMTSAFNDDGVHKLIYTTNIRFKVNDIPKATSEIETIVLNNKGHIVLSSIKNNKSNQLVTNTSADSALYVYNEYLEAQIEFRVARGQLDAVLKAIAPLATSIDYRTITAKDVTFDLVDNDMRQVRNMEKANRMKGRVYKSDDVVDAENAISNARENADNAKLSDYKVLDQIAYSTVVVNLYQNSTLRKEMIARNISEEEYAPGIGSQFVDALANGWYLICAFIIFLINIWPIILILSILTVFYLKYRKKKKSEDIDN